MAPQLNQVVIENMLRLPGLSAETLLKAVQGNAFDHVSAIYNLLVDRLEPTMPSLPSIQSMPGDYAPDGAHQLEKVNIKFDHITQTEYTFQLHSSRFSSQSSAIQKRNRKKEVECNLHQERPTIQQEDTQSDLVIRRISHQHHILIIIIIRRAIRRCGSFLCYSVTTLILKCYLIQICH